MLKRLLKIQLLLLMVILTLNAKTKVMSVANKNGSLHNVKVSEVDSVKFLTDYIEDIDGNVYKIVKIGTQWWMAENLRVTHYNNGTPIPYVSDDTEWSSLATGAYCCHKNNINTAEPTGCLYNWYAVETGKLAPTDWRVATDADWAELETYQKTHGYDGNETVPLKSTQLYGTNIYEFNVLPSGLREEDGAFDNIEHNAYFWTGSTSTNPSNAWYRQLSYYVNNVVQSDSKKKNCGLSIRCIKNSGI